MPDPTVPGVPRKRLRSSESITSRTQPLKWGVKKLQVDKSLESNVRGLLTEETEEHDRGHRLTTSPAHATRTPHNGYEPNATLKSAGKGLPRVQITTGQTGRKTVLKRARSSFKQALPANEDVPKVRGPWRLSDLQHILTGHRQGDRIWRPTYSNKSQWSTGADAKRRRLSQRNPDDHACQKE